MSYEEEEEEEWPPQQRHLCVRRRGFSERGTCEGVPPGSRRGRLLPQRDFPQGVTALSGQLSVLLRPPRFSQVLRMAVHRTLSGFAPGQPLAPLDGRSDVMSLRARGHRRRPTGIYSRCDGPMSGSPAPTASSQRNVLGGDGPTASMEQWRRTAPRGFSFSGRHMGSHLR